MVLDKLRMVYPKPRGRRPQNEERVTFYRSTEFKLKDFISAVKKNRETPCVLELTEFLACLKKCNFNDKMCDEEQRKYFVCMDGSKPGTKEKFKNMEAKDVNLMFKKWKTT